MGDRFAGRLEEGIRRSANGVLVVSPHALSRPWVREEYEALLRQAVEQPERRLIPALYADAARLAQEVRHGPRAWAFWHRALTPAQVLQDQASPADYE